MYSNFNIFNTELIINFSWYMYCLRSIDVTRYVILYECSLNESGDTVGLGNGLMT